MMALRFELHLLAQAFRKDVDDAERPGMHIEHLGFYYEKYYKKKLTLKDYGVEDLKKLLGMVDDTVYLSPKDLIGNMIGEDMENPQVFVKVTEEARRFRSLQLALGNTDAALKLSHQPSWGKQKKDWTGGAGKGGGGKSWQSQQWEKPQVAWPAQQQPTQMLKPQQSYAASEKSYQKPWEYAPKVDKGYQPYGKGKSSDGKGKGKAQGKGEGHGAWQWKQGQDSGYSGYGGGAYGAGGGGGGGYGKSSSWSSGGWGKGKK